MEKPHKKLKVWQLVMDIVTDVYRLTEASSIRGKVWHDFADAPLCGEHTEQYC